MRYLYNYKYSVGRFTVINYSCFDIIVNIASSKYRYGKNQSEPALHRRMSLHTLIKYQVFHGTNRTFINAVYLMFDDKDLAYTDLLVFFFRLSIQLLVTLTNSSGK